MPYRYSKYFPLFTFFCDILFLNVAFFCFYLYSPDIHFFNIRLIIFANLLWGLLAPLFRIYRFSRPVLLRYNFNKFFQVLCLHVPATIFFIYINGGYSHAALIQINKAYLTFVVLIVIQRFALSAGLNFIRKQGYNRRHILIIGDDYISNTLSQHFNKHPEYGYDLIVNAFGENIKNYTDDEIEETLLHKNPDEIFVCYQNIDENLLTFLVTFGQRHAVKIKLVSELILSNSYAKVVNYHNLPALQFENEFSLAKSVQIMKRCFDILFSCVVMLSLAPVYLIIHLITKLSSEGPAYYKQERIGLNGKPFKIIKFRSMYVDAEKYGPQLSTDNDPRITPWGKIIRKTRLDELPQFWNVLKGDMSIVGPRPERSHYIKKITERKPQYEKLLAIKPGITSIGQVHYGYAENIDQMCERMHYDLLYLQDISLNSDLKLILKTVKVMVQGKGK